MKRLDGVHPALADYIDQADQIVREQTDDNLTLQVVSGFRSSAHQAQLMARWNAGDRRGIASRPAARSKHSEGLAVDLGFVWIGRGLTVAETPRAYWEFLADLLRPVGVRWGGTFTPPDMNHFDITVI